MAVIWGSETEEKKEPMSLWLNGIILHEPSGESWDPVQIISICRLGHSTCSSPAETIPTA